MGFPQILWRACYLSLLVGPIFPNLVKQSSTYNWTTWDSFTMRLLAHAHIALRHSVPLDCWTRILLLIPAIDRYCLLITAIDSYCFLLTLTARHRWTHAEHGVLPPHRRWTVDLTTGIYAGWGRRICPHLSRRCPRSFRGYAAAFLQFYHHIQIHFRNANKGSVRWRRWGGVHEASSRPTSGGMSSSSRLVVPGRGVLLQDAPPPSSRPQAPVPAGNEGLLARPLTEVWFSCMHALVVPSSSWIIVKHLAS